MSLEDSATPEAASSRSARVGALFNPRSIAVIGASESAGRGAELINFLRHGGYRGEIFPVNPKYESVFGLTCYASIGDLDTRPDVVAICLRAELVSRTVEECAALGLTTIAVVASGFSERGDEVGRAREAELAAVCARHDVVLMGPNCVGINNRLDQVNYWLTSIFRPDRPQSGASIVMQSGALVSTAVHLASSHGLDLDFGISSGNEVVLRAEDYVEYILARGGARVIGLMRESIKEPERFARICLQARERDVAIVVLPVGRSEASRRISASHTGSLIGSSDVFSAFYRAVGVLEAKSIDEWISMLLLMSQPYRPAGKRIGMYSLSGGGSALLADLAADVQLDLVPIPQHTVTALKKLADDRPVSNPVDAGGYYGNRLAVPTAAQALLTDPELDAVAVCANAYRSQGMAWSVVEAALTAEGGEGKPFAVFAYGSDQPSEEQQEACLARGAYPLMGATSALPAIDAWLGWSSWRPSSRIAEMRVGGATTAGRLDVADVLDSLAARGVRLPRRTEIDPERPADAGVEFPLVLKLENDTVQHKTDLGLVELGVNDDEQLATAARRLSERAWELRLPGPSPIVAYSQVPDGIDMILGMVRDPVLGPAITVGAGGIYVEVLADLAVAIPPLGPEEARRLLDRLKFRDVLAGARHGAPGDVDALVDAIVAFSEVAAAAPADVRSMEINPLRVMPGNGGAWALDVLIDN